MNTIDLAIIGLSQEELQNRVVSSIVGRMLTATAFDYDSDTEYPTNSQFSKKLTEGIKKAIDDKFEQLVESSIVPVIASKVDELVIQRTNQYGEKKGTPVTFLEYLIERADQFMIEPVDSKGRTAAECERARDSFYAVIGSNRLVMAIDKCLGDHLQKCVSAVVKDSTEKVGAAMSEALKSALSEAQAKLKIEVKRA